MTIDRGERERVRGHHPDPVDPRVAQDLRAEGGAGAPPCRRLGRAADGRPSPGSNRPVREVAPGVRAQPLRVLVQDLEHLGAERLGDARRLADRLRKRQRDVHRQPGAARHPPPEARAAQRSGPASRGGWRASCATSSGAPARTSGARSPGRRRRTRRPAAASASGRRAGRSDRARASLLVEVLEEAGQLHVVLAARHVGRVRDAGAWPAGRPSHGAWRSCGPSAR